MRNKTRYALVMLIGVLMNQICYTVALVLKLPVWLDMSGTMFAAMVLEPTAGLMVGLVNNFYLAVTRHDSSSLIYYAVSAAAALIAGTCMRKNGKIFITPKRVFATAGYVVLASSVLSTLLTLWRSPGGVPDAQWEAYLFGLASGAGLPTPLACLFGVLVVKIIDIAASVIIIALCYALTPAKLKFERAEHLAKT